uniref:Uncharacterized protein n=1 Tax=Aegilops tauschii subsp. strangulata TaxID=200361 RepID=A0A453NMJ4_AEGTS
PIFISRKDLLFSIPKSHMFLNMPYHLQQAVLEDSKKTIRELQLDENRKKELASALHSQFKDWLYATGNIRQLYCLQGD